MPLEQSVLTDASATSLFCIQRICTCASRMPIRKPYWCVVKPQFHVCIGFSSIPPLAAFTPLGRHAACDSLCLRCYTTVPQDTVKLLLSDFSRGFTARIHLSHVRHVMTLYVPAVSQVYVSRDFSTVLLQLSILTDTSATTLLCTQRVCSRGSRMSIARPYPCLAKPEPRACRGYVSVPPLPAFTCFW